MAHGHEDKYWPLGIPAHYGKIWLTLTILFGVSYLGPLEIAPNVSKIAGANVGWVVMMVTAFGIAFWKASLVVREFMHLPLEKHFIWYIEGVVVAFMLLFFFAVSPDVMQHEGRNWENRAALAAVERGKQAAPALKAKLEEARGEGAAHEEAPATGHDAGAKEPEGAH
jgi:hypothetical protein